MRKSQERFLKSHFMHICTVKPADRTGLSPQHILILNPIHSNLICKTNMHIKTAPQLVLWHGTLSYNLQRRHPRWVLL